MPLNALLFSQDQVKHSDSTATTHPLPAIPERFLQLLADPLVGSNVSSRRSSVLAQRSPSHDAVKPPVNTASNSKEAAVTTANESSVASQPSPAFTSVDGSPSGKRAKTTRRLRELASLSFSNPGPKTYDAAGRTRRKRT